jgi:hypothetical protein
MSDSQTPKFPPNPDTKGPYIVWQDWGYDGWSPTSYNTLKDALSASRMTSRFVLTKVVDVDVVEAAPTGPTT